jgi:hypothetical protein
VLFCAAKSSTMAAYPGGGSGCVLDDDGEDLSVAA